MQTQAASQFPSNHRPIARTSRELKDRIKEIPCGLRVGLIEMVVTLSDYDNDVFGHIASFTSLEILQVLFLAGKSLLLSKTDIRALAQLKNLRKLEITQVDSLRLRLPSWDTDEMEAFFGSFPKMESLNLSILCPFTTIALQTLVKTSPKLQECRLTGYWSLAPLRGRKLPELKHLHRLVLGCGAPNPEFEQAIRSAFDEGSNSDRELALHDIKKSYLREYSEYFIHRLGQEIMKQPQ